MKRRTSVAAIFLLAVGLIAGRADAAEPCPTGLVEGKRITVLVEGDGPDVVLIPGLSSPRAVWDTTADRLKDKYRLPPRPDPRLWRRCRDQCRGTGARPDDA